LTIGESRADRGNEGVAIMADGKAKTKTGQSVGGGEEGARCQKIWEKKSDSR